MSSHVSSSFSPLSFCHHRFDFACFHLLALTCFCHRYLLLLPCFSLLAFAYFCHCCLLPTCFHHCCKLSFACYHLFSPLPLILLACFHHHHLPTITCFYHLLSLPLAYFCLFVFIIKYLVYFRLFCRMHGYFVVCLFEFQIRAPCLVLPPFSI